MWGSKRSHQTDPGTCRMMDSDDSSVSVFLETSVQIDRIIGKQERRDTIKQNLLGQRVSTSGHVLGEFNKTLIQDAITFRDLLVSSPTVGEAVKRLRRYDRRFPRTVDLLATLGLDDNKQNTIDRLEKFIEWQGYDQFWEPVTDGGYVDRVGCVLKQWTPRQDESGSYNLNGLKCLKENPPPCAVQKFIERNRDLIEGFVLASQGATRSNVNRAAAALEGILNGSDVPFGERSNCYAIADIMIVLESNLGSEVYSSDGDVATICELMGRRRYQEKLLPT